MGLIRDVPTVEELFRKMILEGEMILSKLAEAKK